MKLQKCNTCKTVFHNKPWIDECLVCRSYDINHNEDKSLFEWYNYGDVNFMEYGGCLVRETGFKDCFEVIWLVTEIPDYKGKYKKPMIVAKCYIDLNDWLNPKDENRKELNTCCGFDIDYIPHSLDEKMCYCVDMINSYGYGIWEFDPVFPVETNCGCYSMGIPIEKLIVGKQIAQRFLKEYDVPIKFRK